MRYGEKEIKEFDVDKDLEFWENIWHKMIMIKLTLLGLPCRSGIPILPLFMWSICPISLSLS